MESGSRPAPGRRRPSRPGEGRRGAAAATLALLASTILLFACSRGPRDFAEARAALDAALAGAPSSRELDKAFEPAFRRAKGSTEWLSVLKRAAQADARAARGGTGVGSPAGGAAARGPAAAERALKAMPGSEPVAAAAAYLFLRGGAPEKALALFKEALKPEDRPELWAEAFLASLRAGARPSPEEAPAAYDRLARVLGDPRFFADSAAASLAAGDGFAARATLGLAIQRGAAPPDELLWDAGLPALLAARPDEGAGPERLRLLADAAWLSGDAALAKARWERAIFLAPKASYKPYASLLAAEAAEAAKAAALAALDDASRAGRAPARAYDDSVAPPFSFDPSAPPLRAAPAGAAGPSAKGEGRFPRSAGRVSSADYERLTLLFPDESAPKALYAAALAREGRGAEALDLLLSGGDEAQDSLSARVALAATAGSWPEDRLASQALRLAESRPEDGELLDSVLRLLLERGRSADFLVLFRAAESRGLSYPRRAFHAAAAAALAGDYRAAVALLEKDGPSEPGPEAAFALGLLYSRLGDQALAADRLAVALSAARSGAERCRTLKATGDARAAAGDPEGALAAYRAASAADPGDAEAASLARGKPLARP